MGKRFWIAVVVCYLVYQALGFLVHNVWLDDTYEALRSLWRPEAQMMDKYWVFFVTSLVTVVLFCYIFTKGYENKGVPEGVRYGALIGLLFSVPMAYDSYVMYPIPYSLALQWFLSGFATFVVLGAVLAAIYRPDAAAGK